MTTLPSRLTKFVGRRPELISVRTALAENRLVTLTGAGGIGKTRLAIEVATQVAGQFPDGLYYVDLASISEPLAVAEVIAHCLGLPDQPGRSASSTLRRYVAERRLLLILDNCEHLLPACCTLIETILNGSAKPKILTTSREPVGVAGELIWCVPPLSLIDDAAELFLDRARLAWPEFTGGTSDPAIILDICRLLDGLPLAIELAAALIRALSVGDIHRHLVDRLDLLTDARAGLHRHRTLRASVDWSYEMLSDGGRDLFCRLGVFPGAFDLKAAVAIGGGQQSAVRDFVCLVGKSLIVAETDSGTMRYRLLETMRQYALGKLEESGDVGAVRSVHRDYYVEMVATLATFPGGERQRLVNWALTEFENLRAAYVRCREDGNTEMSLRLASSLQPFWLDRGRLREGMSWFEQALPEEPGSIVKPEVWIVAVVCTSTLGAWLEVPTNLGRALAAASIAEDLGDPVLTARARNVCSILTRYDVVSSRGHLDEAIRLARESGDRPTLCETLFSQTVLNGGMAGDPRSARLAAEECLGIADALNDEFMSWSGRIWLGHALLMMGDLNGAVRVLAPLVRQRGSAGQLFMSFYAHVFLGRAHAYRGQAESARACLEGARATASTMGGFQDDVAYAMLAEACLAGGDGLAAKAASEASWRHTVTERLVFNQVLNPIPEVLLACGDVTAARQWADEAVVIAQGSNKIAALNARAHIARAQHELQRTARDCQAALDIAQTTRAFLRLPDVIECLAGLATLDGKHRTAGRMFAAAAAFRAENSISRFPLYQDQYDKDVGTCRKSVGDQEFDTAWAEGNAMSADEIIAYARRGRGKRRRPSSGWESLTPTEREVSALVQEGLRNNEIGARLFISRRTVQTHLTHIYAKLGIDSRVGLAQEAARHIRRSPMPRPPGQ